MHERYPIVSVVVPAYNGERHIRQCGACWPRPCPTESSIKRRITDGTGSLLDDMAARDDRMRVIHRRTREGRPQRRTGRGARTLPRVFTLTTSPNRG
ncbi:MAG: hypothetical protein ACLSVD_17855 [Eggerthellaceae bacterium]